MTDQQVPQSIRVAIVNDFEIVVRGLRAMLAKFSDRVEVVELVVGETPDRPVDIALFDTFVSQDSSLGRIQEIIADPRIDRMVVYSWAIDSQSIEQSVAHPIDGIISKAETGSDLIDKLEAVMRGERVEFDIAPMLAPLTELSGRQREVLALLASGKSNKAIGDELVLSTDTVKTHVRHLLRKLDVRNRTEAATLARGLGFVRRITDSQSPATEPAAGVHRRSTRA